VVQSVKDQGKEVAAETGRQAGNLYGQVRSELRDQAGAQQRRAVSGLYALGDEVAKMAHQGGQSGPATQAARQAANSINQAAQWLERREPGHVLDEVKNFARRRPAVFFAGAAVLGVVAGRLTRNITSESAGGPDERLTTDSVPTGMTTYPASAPTVEPPSIPGVVPAPAQPTDALPKLSTGGTSSESHPGDQVSR
jgi:hypothetical protein